MGNKAQPDMTAAKVGDRAAGGDVVVAVDRNGVAWVEPMTETARVDFALRFAAARAAVPAYCSDAIQPAPARGKVAEFVPMEMIPDSRGNVRAEHMGYRCRSGARVRDAFDEMTDQAQRRHAGKGKKSGLFVPPFTSGQVCAGRDYAALTERCNASGVKCSSLEALRQASRGGDREAAVFRDFARLRALHRRIGDGLAKEVRRIRPNGRKRRAIYVRRLVDLVCLGNMAVSDVLKVHGWGNNQGSRDALRTSLCAALDRMQGYELDEPS